jgi:multiple sugar transport system permease protein
VKAASVPIGGLDAGRRRGIRARVDRLPEGRFAALAAAPGLLLVVLFIVPPVMAAVALSFFRIELGSDSYTPFVGLRNYVVRLPADAEFLGTLPLTLAFAGVTTVIALPIALGAATLINGRRRFRGLLGLLLILPWAVAPIADGIFWRLTISTTINDALRAFGLPIVVLGQAPGNLLTILLAVVWRAIPLLGVLMLGALRQVPGDLGRAARLDGASSWQAFRYVTLPAIAPTLIVAGLLQVILTLQVFDVQFGVSGDNPPRGSVLAATQIYRTVIGQISLGYGAAETMVLAAFIALCLFGIWRLVVRPANLARTVAEDTDDLVASETRRLRLSLPAGPPGAASNRSSSLAAESPAIWHVDPGTRTEPAARPSAPALRAIRARVEAVIRAMGALLLAVWLGGPIVWIVIASTQTEFNLAFWPPHIGPPFILAAYQALIANPAWQAAALVSITVSIGATALALAVATMTAYPLARYRMRRGRALLLFLLGTQLIPPIALALPILYIFLRLDLKNTLAGLVLINAAFWTPILVWLVRAAFLAVPRNLESAARIDGASRLGVIARVTLPVAGPAVAAAAAIVFVGIWNDFVFVAVLGGRDTYTLPRYLGETFTPQYHVLAARIVLTVAPCIALVAIFRRRILGFA